MFNIIYHKSVRRKTHILKVKDGWMSLCGKTFEEKYVLKKVEGRAENCNCQRCLNILEKQLNANEA